MAYDLVDGVLKLPRLNNNNDRTPSRKVPLMKRKAKLFPSFHVFLILVCWVAVIPQTNKKIIKNSLNSQVGSHIQCKYKKSGIFAFLLLPYQKPKTQIQGSFLFFCFFLIQDKYVELKTQYK